MGETTNLNWWIPDFFHQQYIPSWLRCETNHHKVTQLFASALVKAEDVSPEVVAKALRFMYTGSVEWEKGLTNSFGTLSLRSFLGNRMGVVWDGVTGTHVELGVKEVIQWSKTWSKHVCIKKCQVFQFSCHTKKSLAFPKDLVDQKHQQKPTKPRWSCRWCGYWVFGICTQVRHYRWAWNFGEEEKKEIEMFEGWLGYWKKICDDMIHHVWFEEKEVSSAVCRGRCWGCCQDSHPFRNDAACQQQNLEETGLWKSSHCHST